jgi:hypothetical protein
MHRFALYAALNLLFLLVVIIADVNSGSQNTRILYQILLFALCSTSVIDLDGLNGRYALLAVFSLAYFVMFGVGDLFALMQGTTTEPSLAVLSATEAVILVGGTVLFASYRLLVWLSPGTRRGAAPRDWPRRAVFIGGLLMWAIGTYATYHWYVYIVTAQTNEATRKGLESISALQTSIFILAQMMQPLGILLIAYLWRIYRPPLIWGLVLAICALQVVVGFIADIKGLAMLGGILVIVTIVLVDGRVPKWWLAAGVAYIIIVFPIFQAYRAEVTHARGIARTAIVADLSRVLDLALSANARVNTGRNRAQTFLERSSLFGSVQIIVEKTGNEAPYQHGYTLTPILAAYVPKIVWSDKPDIPTGQIFNKEFHITDSDDVFISPSHLGELYWNFGWPGVILGMAIIGGILGFVGTRFNLAQGKTVTRLLVTVVTIKQLVTGFESSIAAIYVVWLRSLAGIGVLHLLLARVPAAAALISPRELPGDFAAGPSAGGPFPNLLR